MPNNGTLSYNPTTEVQNIPAGYTAGGTINAVNASIDTNITTDNIKAGVNILNITGTFTSDANATSIDIIGSNKTAYVNGQKITGTHYFIIDGSMFMLSSIENVANLGSNIEITTNNLSGQYVLRNNAKIIMDVPQTDIANVVNLTPDKIKLGENILGIEGNVIAANLTNLDVTPSINIQSITPNSPYNGFNVVNISAVTANIDPNITSNNILSGVTILGVTGDTNIVNTYVEEGTYMPVTANDIPDYRVAYVNGERIEGTVSDARGVSSGDQIYNISETSIQGQHFIEVPRLISGTVIMDETCNITDEVAESDIANVINLTPDKVRAGTNVLDITGTFTSDANATAINIKNGVTAYVNGQLIVGNLPSLSYPKNPNNAADYNYEFAQGTKAYTYKRGYTNYLVGTNQIAAETMPDSWMFEGNRKMKLGIPFGAAASAVGLTSNLLIAGANVLGIKGNANTIKTYNSVSDMEADTTVVANCSYGIEMRTTNNSSYIGALYQYNGTNWSKLLDRDDPISPDDFAEATALISDIKGSAVFDINIPLNMYHEANYTNVTLADLNTVQDPGGDVTVSVQGIYPWIEWFHESDEYFWAQ